MSLYHDKFQTEGLYSYIELADMIGNEANDKQLTAELSWIANFDSPVPPKISELAIQEDLYHKVEDLKELLAMPDLTNE